MGRTRSGQGWSSLKISLAGASSRSDTTSPCSSEERAADFESASPGSSPGRGFALEARYPRSG
jgi:hypothetical protein